MKTYIKRLSVSCNGKKDSIIEFQPGMNIIYGPSNCGKSLIADCIDFALGCETLQIKPEFGCNRVTLELQSEIGAVSISRKVGSDDFNVLSQDYRVKQGKYSRKGTKNKPSINVLMLALMGISPPPQIISRARMDTQTLGWRTFAHMLIIDENRVQQKRSILLPTQIVTQYPAKTALLYLINGENYIPEGWEKDSQSHVIRKEAVVNFIHEQLKSLDERKARIEELPNDKPENLQTSIDTLLNELSTVKGESDQVCKKIEALSGQIIELVNEQAETAALRERYQALQTQYAADLRRITFIAEGEIAQNGIQKPIKCPFCGGTLEKRQEQSCSEAARIEIQHLLPLMQDLQNASNELEETQARTKSEIEILEQKRSGEEQHLKEEIKPRIDQLRATLLRYDRAVNNAKEVALIESYRDRLLSQIKELNEDQSLSATFSLEAHYNDSLTKQIGQSLFETLKGCHYIGLNESDFNLVDFDLVVNGSSKATFGKGYRAFLNTVTAISIQEYLSHHGKYQPGFLLIDSPILSLKETGDEKAPDSMKSSLFKYMIDHQSDRQTIIIENDIPELDYSNVCLIPFTKEESHGRYGFLEGVY